MPEINWLKNLYHSINDNPQVNVFSGKILIDRENIPQWVKESFNLRTILFSEQDYGEELYFFPEDKYPSGPFLAVRKNAINVDSPWPVNIGPGTTLPVGDERIFLKRISDPKSKDRLYVPESIIYHHTDKNNDTLIQYLKRCYYGGYAAGLTSKSNSSINNSSIYKLIISRLRTCRSIRELMCMIIRTFGFYYSKYNAEKIKTKLNI